MRAEKAHFLRIDTLRGIAILMVFLFHFSLTIHQRDSRLAIDSTLPPSLSWILTIHKIGVLGVPLFFVISGFCIHYSFLSWKKRSPGRSLPQFFRGFFHRRFWRIVPPYLVALLCFYFVKTPHPFSGEHLSNLLPHLALTNTLIEGQFFQINPSFWSVAVEWQLYLAYPLVLWMFLRFGPVKAFVAATIVSAIFRFYTPGWGLPFWVQNLPFRWWYDWSIGVFIAACWADRRRIFPDNVWLGAALAAFTYYTIVFTNWIVLRWIMPPLFFAYLVEACVWSTRPVGRTARAAALVGVCSYSLYLWHQPMMHWIVSYYGQISTSSGPISIWLGLCLVLLVIVLAMAAASYFLIEKPSIAIGHWSLSTYQARKAAAARSGPGENLAPLPANPE
jgi:peptidoglycan/LPS O-acetylase OafA/YrhL